jgi:hypothetical protein
MKAEYVRQQEEIESQELRMVVLGFDEAWRTQLLNPLRTFNANLADDLREWELKQKGEGK